MPKNRTRNAAGHFKREVPATLKPQNQRALRSIAYYARRLKQMVRLVKQFPDKQQDIDKLILEILAARGLSADLVQMMRD